MLIFHHSQSYSIKMSLGLSFSWIPPPREGPELVPPSRILWFLDWQGALGQPFPCMVRNLESPPVSVNFTQTQRALPGRQFHRTGGVAGGGWRSLLEQYPELASFTSKFHGGSSESASPKLHSICGGWDSQRLAATPTSWLSLDYGFGATVGDLSCWWLSSPLKTSRKVEAAMKLTPM